MDLSVGLIEQDERLLLGAWEDVYICTCANKDNINRNKDLDQARKELRIVKLRHVIVDKEAV